MSSNSQWDKIGKDTLIRLYLNAKKKADAYDKLIEALKIGLEEES